jgi:hypothetical protein
MSVIWRYVSARRKQFLIISYSPLRLSSLGTVGPVDVGSNSSQFIFLSSSELSGTEKGRPTSSVRIKHYQPFSAWKTVQSSLSRISTGRSGTHPRGRIGEVSLAVNANFEGITLVTQWT